MFVSATEDQVGKELHACSLLMGAAESGLELKSAFDDLGQPFNCLFVVLLNSSRCQYNISHDVLIEHLVFEKFLTRYKMVGEIKSPSV